jgi:DNA invertase Pin-like site-specific DNA recombinase
MSKNVRGYCRVSTDLQLDGVSLEVQEARITQYCTEHGYTLLKIYKEAMSGKNVKREQLQLLLSELNPREIVVVVDLSRLSRTTLDALQLIDRFTNMNVGFVAITQPFDTTNPMGEAMMVVQMTFNQLERKNTAIKVKGAMQTLKMQGKLRGRPPFGWKFAGKENDFAADPEQQRVLDKIKRLHAAGESMTAIARQLNESGDNQVLASNKKRPEKFEEARFHQTTIKRILVENGLMDGGNLKRKPVQLQIVSHHK